MSTEDFAQDELLESELAEAQPKPETGMYDMVSEYTKICHALGIQTRNFDEMDLYLCVGKIINAVCPYYGEFTGPAPMTINVIRKMTPQQRAAVREQVLGVVALPSKKR